MTRWIYRLAAAVAIFTPGPLSAAQPAADQPVRPNFVVIVADDMAWDDMGAYGNAKIKTPHLDRLARSGMRFDRAFLTCSSCSPSRASILTGRYPHATAAAELHMPVPATQVLLTEPLRKAGYYTAAAGKWHLGPAVKAQFDTVKEGGGPGGYAHWLPVLRDRPQGKPFFLWLASTDPHRPYHPNAIREPHRPQDVIVPPYLPDVSDARGDLALYYDAIGRLDQNVGLVVEELARQKIEDRTLVIFLSDNGRPFPRCKTTVLDSGVQTPFVVAWPGTVKPGIGTTSLVSSVDLAPTLLELAGLKPLASFQGKSFAALLTNPKAEIRAYCFAEHNWHDYQAFERGVRSKDFAYVRNGLPELPRTPPADAVRSPTFQAMRELRDQKKLTPAQNDCFVAPRATEELYDIMADPHSLRNVAGDPRYAAKLAEMRAALADWQRETADAQPAELTPDKFDRETGMGLGAKKAAKPPAGKAAAKTAAGKSPAAKPNAAQRESE